ncbi:Ubiquitin carboxyl-terminal hydrolase family protein [Zostera marina]|uniref:Ubiquitin carboxyl-terminal hydrolase family protein n=1 Tax=Zostera marina TaxID=29655 RepID=A0A0K9PTA7_ZOSMR|nr:Ubiquitin carboxyl-terminal hydrolase family protein [Zostera marina]
MFFTIRPAAAIRNLLHRRSVSMMPHLNTSKLKKKKKKESPRTKLIQQEPALINPYFESILQDDTRFRFVTRSKDFLSRQPDHVLRLDDAGKFHRELGFPRGRKFTTFAQKHPLLFSLYRHSDTKCWVGFTDLMEELIREENAILETTVLDQVRIVKKLLMMSKEKKIPLSKIHHCRHIFGISGSFRDIASNYPDELRLNMDEKKKTMMIELVNWDPTLAVSKLEKDFISEEDRVRRMFKFPVTHGKWLGLDSEDMKRMDSATTLPLVSPYTDGWNWDLWTVEAEKYRVGVLHEFLSLTLEKRASIHHIVEFKEELSLTKHTYRMLMKQHRAFYLAGTEMNWGVFLREGYREEDGTLLDNHPLVLFKKKLLRHAFTESI